MIHYKLIEITINVLKLDKVIFEIVVQYHSFLK